MYNYFAIVKTDENIIVGISDKSENDARMDANQNSDYIVNGDLFGNVVRDGFESCRISRGLYEQVKQCGGDVDFEKRKRLLVPCDYYHVLVDVKENIVYGIGVAKMDAYVDSVKNSLTKIHTNPENMSIVRVTKEFFNMVKKFGGDMEYDEKYKWAGE